MRLSNKEVSYIAEVCQGMNRLQIKEITNAYYKQKKFDAKIKKYSERVVIKNTIQDLVKSLADKKSIGK